MSSEIIPPMKRIPPTSFSPYKEAGGQLAHCQAFCLYIVIISVSVFFGWTSFPSTSFPHLKPNLNFKKGGGPAEKVAPSLAILEASS